MLSQSNNTAPRCCLQWLGGVLGLVSFLMFILSVHPRFEELDVRPVCGTRCQCTRKWFVQEQDLEMSDIGDVILGNALGGFHGCLWPDGQTGAGESHAVMGYGAEVRGRRTSGGSTRRKPRRRAAPRWLQAGGVPHRVSNSRGRGLLRIYII